MSDQLKITSLWKRTTNAGDTYLSGRMPLMDGMFVNIYPRKNKKNPKEPDFDMVIQKAKAQQTTQDTESEHSLEGIPY